MSGTLITRTQSHPIPDPATDPPTASATNPPTSHTRAVNIYHANNNNKKNN